MRNNFFKTIVIIFICPLLVIPGNTGSTKNQENYNIIYDDALALSWDDWSWTDVDWAAIDPVHTGNHSVAVTYGSWEGVYIHKSDVDTLGITHLQFFIHGGVTGNQNLEVYMNLEVNGIAQTGPRIQIPAPLANTWSEVQIMISDLNPTNEIVTGITWQSTSRNSQPTFYLDDISMVSLEDPDGPTISDVFVSPRSIPADESSTIILRSRVNDPHGSEDIASVSVDARPVGNGIVQLYDNGKSNDYLANDGIYGASITVSTSTPASERRLLLTAEDLEGHQNFRGIGTIYVITPPGGETPSVLPQQISYGTNTWSFTPGEDWQVNSNIPWNYVYQRITWGWESLEINNFVSQFVQQAWAKNYIPLVTVYMMRGVPPDCGEGGECYAQKLQNAATVQDYLDSLERVASEARGTKPVIIQLEPDFYGFMQQLSNLDNRPPGIVPNDPSTFPVALNKIGYPDNLAGFGRYMVDLIHNTASNALVAPSASEWATNSDPQSVTYISAIDMAKKTAVFIDQMGGSQADLLVVGWSDRDAGSGLRPWWDETDYETPRPTRAILWDNTLSKTSGKYLILWQVPVGNMSQDNTCGHYQDNRAKYVFDHPRDLFDAGIIGVLFGGGTDCMTQVYTDGGFVAQQAKIAYATPSTPDGFEASVPDGPYISLNWNETTDPDLWKYKVEYRLLPDGSTITRNVGRKNNDVLRLLFSGLWEIQLVAVDAMGNQSTPTSPITVDIVIPGMIYLPAILQKSP